MNLAWITDTHFNFIKDKTKEQLVLLKYKTECDNLIITGDIAESDSIENALKTLSEHFKSVFFVLGNHDYWGSSISEVRGRVREFSSKFPNLHYMDGKLERLTEEVAIVGSNGFYDGRNGMATDIFGRPIVKLNEWAYIDEFKGKSFSTLLNAIQEVAFGYAQEAKEALIQACQKFKKIIFLTHIPPFPQATMSDGFHLPWYSSEIMGDVLSEVASEFPSTQIHVLCGHTHYPVTYHHFDNLVVHAGVADYGKLFVSGIVNPSGEQMITIS